MSDRRSSFFSPNDRSRPDSRGDSATDWFLIDLVRERLDFPDQKRRIQGMADRWQADTVLIEYAGSGISLLQQLRQDDKKPWRYVPIVPRQDKVFRVEAQTARMETGKYLLPANGSFLEMLRREVSAFPNGRHDDQVDSLIQFIEWEASARGQSFVQRDPKTGRPKRINRPDRTPRPDRIR